MAETGAIANIGDLGKPFTALIEKIAEATGGAFRPFQIKRVAKAEAEAEIIRAQAGIEITDLQRRAMVRWIGEEAKKQDNMEEIARKALPHMADSADPKRVEDDWVS